MALACVLLSGCSLAPNATPSPADSSSAIPSGNRPFRPTLQPSPTFSRYVVKRGDTLATIAERFGTSVDSLSYWNRARYPSLDPDSPGYAPDRIQAGWTLGYIPNTLVDPNNLPPGPSATVSAQPTASRAPYPSLPANGAAIFVLQGPANSDEVALTFDYTGGPGAGADAGEGADAIVQRLAADGIPATIFVAPEAAGPADPAGRAVIDRIRQAAVGGTMRAGLLGDAAALARPDGSATLKAADTAVAGVLGSTTAPWLRATGTLTPPALAAAGAAGWRWAIGWDVDPGDSVTPALGGPIAADIMARVVSDAQGGSIVHLSLNGTYTLEALPGIIDGLASAGLRVVSLGELLGVSSAP